MIAELLRDNLVDFIAMDIKHSWEKYAQVIGINQKIVIDQCRETCDLIQNSGIAHEFRTTVYPALHSIQDLQHIAGQLNEGTHYALQEIRYEKTFETQLSKTKKMDLREVSRLIAEQYPQLHIEVRTASPV
jgi:pyruvate formate lyase activating enzyme